MKGLLIRVGIDSQYGRWNAPVDSETWRFAYVPIPEEYPVRSGYEKIFDQFAGPCQGVGRKLPDRLLGRSAHLDPDFHCLTYGDTQHKGERTKTLQDGDVIAFYGGLNPVKSSEHESKLIYALIGLYIVDKAIFASEIDQIDWDKNAHTRRQTNESDVIVFAKPEVSGRLERCIPIGEFRSGAYRVRQDLLEKWGGLSVKDGFIQRSATLPWFNDAGRFLEWFRNQGVALVSDNN